MTVRDQDAVKAFKAYTALKNLALGAFTAIDQEAEFIVLDHLCGQAAAC